jgi:hypothetical protein
MIDRAYKIVMNGLVLGFLGLVALFWGRVIYDAALAILGGL